MLINYCRLYPKNLLKINIAQNFISCNRTEYSITQERTLLSIRIANHVLFRRNSKFNRKYSDAVQCAINQQIKAEQQAAQEYLSMAVMFLHPCVSRPGTGGFFMNMYEEEIGHMHSFIQYQLLRGGTVLLNDIKMPSNSNPINLTMQTAFQRALAMEQTITELLENLVSVAEKAKDYQCAEYVTSVFLSEQIKSIDKLAHHVTKLSRLSDEPSLYLYDSKLAETHPIKYKLNPS